MHPPPPKKKKNKTLKILQFDFKLDSDWSKLKTEILLSSQLQQLLRPFVYNPKFLDSNRI